MAAVNPYIVADVGGTNARFALVPPNSTDVYNAETLKVKDFAHIADAFRHYIKNQNITDPDQACVALAGPVEGDQVHLTNGDWAFSVEQTRQDLGLQKLQVINDFKAQAAAIPYLKQDELLLLGGKEPVAGRFKVIVGPGTGLGVAGAIETSDGVLIVQGEGGHIGLSPTTDREMAVHQKLLEQYGRVSAERIVCGSGLRKLHQTLQELDGRSENPRTEAEVVAMALAGDDATCSEALDMFLAYLGAVAGDQALTFGAVGGVYIAGGIVPRVKDYIANSQFRTRFEAKGRLTHMIKNIPTYLVMARKSGVIGAAACLIESNI